MSRRPANFIQADVARAMRAAEQVGPDWRVEIDGGVIRLTRATTTGSSPVEVPPLGKEPEPDAEPKWRL